MTIIGRGINRVLLRKEGTLGISWCAALPQLLVSPALCARSLRLSPPQCRTTGLKMGQAAGKQKAPAQTVQQQEAAAQKMVDYTRLPKVGTAATAVLKLVKFQSLERLPIIIEIDTIRYMRDN